MSAVQTAVRFDAENHKYFLGDKELASVSSVLRVWPQEPCSQCKWPMFSDHVEGCSVKANVDHARIRGQRVDSYAQQYVKDGRVTIPAGEWVEVRNLTEKVVAWLQSATAEQCGVKPYVETQVIVHDDEIAGTLDFRINRRITDLKCTYDLSYLHRLQVAAYIDLSGVDDDGGLLHVTERFKQAKYVPFDVQECIKQWRTIRSFWSLWKRSTNGKS